MAQPGPPKDPVWLSTVAPRDNVFGNLTLSVVLDAGLWRKYAGIQLMLILVEHPNISAPLGFGFGTPVPARVRPSFSYINADSIRSVSNHRVGEQLRFCPVTLGVEFRTDRDSSWCVVEPFVGARKDPRLRQPVAVLVNDKILLPSPDCSTSNPHTIEIEFSLDCNNFKHSRSWTRGRDCAPEHQAQEIYFIRVLPCHRDRPGPRSLPPEVLQTIGRFIPKSRQLLSAALVQKSWFTIMKAFFERLGRGNDLFIYPIDNFARAVQTRSTEWGPLITSFDLRDFRVEECPRYYVHGISDIFKHTPNLRQLAINSFVLTRAKEDVSKLRKIQDFGCTSYGMKGQSVSWLLSVQQIQEIIADMPKLRRLWLSGKGKAKSSYSRDAGVPSKPPQYQLEELSIDNEKLSVQQLEHFLTYPNQASRLHTLKLESIDGVSPNDMLALLSSIAPTVKYLRILNCDDSFIRIGPEGEEESILDTLLPKMVHLMMLELRGRVLTRNVLSWIPISTERETTLAFYVRRENINTEDGFDVFSEIEDIHISWSLIRAIFVKAKDDHSRTPVSSREEAIKLSARERGLNVKFKYES